MKEKWELTDLYKGAHIRVKMNNFYHHGIYIGDGMVVQFGMPNNVFEKPENVKVLKSPISSFSSDGFIEVRIYNKKELKQKRSNDEIVKEALSHVGEGGYNILHNNCEHFANFCVFGKKQSTQMDNVYENVKHLLKK